MMTTEHRIGKLFLISAILEPVGGTNHSARCIECAHGCVEELARLVGHPRSSATVRRSVPHQLHRYRQDQESENTIHRAHRAGAKALYQWTSQAQAQINGQAERTY